MEYPKPVMTKAELKDMGFSESWLMAAFRTQGNRAIAWKVGNGRNSRIEYDTQALEAYRKACCVSK